MLVNNNNNSSFSAWSFWTSLQNNDGNYDLQYNIFKYVVLTDFHSLILVCKNWKRLFLKEDSNSNNSKLVSQVIRYMFSQYFVYDDNEYDVKSVKLIINIFKAMAYCHTSSLYIK